MIGSFADGDTQALFEGRAPRRFGASVPRMLDKLQILHTARTLDDLRSPPGNRLEALSGNRRGQYSIRINDQWRLCFRWQGEHAVDVEIIDYH
jgi:proteic killer suppression protein